MNTPLNPSWGDVFLHPGGPWENSLPDVPHPYYVIGDEGTFLHRRTAQGRGLVRTTKSPKGLHPLGTTTGSFVFDAKPIPATLYAQAVSFFRRTFERHKAEAEVLITQHHETKEYRLFVPTQRVSAGGVYSIYNPRDIAPGWLVVGTFHSHCNFSPYHSTTDEGDARDMDGLHGTIGFVTHAKPEMALMYALNGSFFHFATPHDEMVDTSDLTADTAPTWWDRYIVLGPATDATRPAWANDDTWDRYMGRYKRPTTTIVATRPGPLHHAIPSPPPRWLQHNYRGDQDSLRRWFGGGWDGNVITHEPHLLLPSHPTTQHPPLAPDEPDYWEDKLGDAYIDTLFDSGLFTEEDLDVAVDKWPETGERIFWEKRFRAKLFRTVAWLRAQGYTVTVHLKQPTSTPRPTP